MASDQPQRMHDQLLQLPPGVIHRIWQELESACASTAVLHASRHAILCSCRHLRSLCAPWIKASVLVNIQDGQDVRQPQELGPAWDAAMQQAFASLACVPQGAQLDELRWNVTTQHAYALHPGLLPTFLHQRSARCRHITTMHIECSMVRPLRPALAKSLCWRYLHHSHVAQSTARSCKRP